MKNKNNLIGLIIISIFLITSSLIYAEDIKYDKNLTQKIQKIIKDTNTIKSGIIRAIY